MLAKTLVSTQFLSRLSSLRHFGRVVNFDLHPLTMLGGHLQVCLDSVEELRRVVPSLLVI